MTTSFERWLRILKIGLNVSAFAMLAALLRPFGVNSGQTIEPLPSVAHDPATPRITIAQRPLAFEPNRGQTAEAVRYLVHGLGYELFVTDRDLILSAARPDPKAAVLLDRRAIGTRSRLKLQHFKRDLVRIRLAGGARHPAFEATAPMAGSVNYFLGNDPKKWRTKIPLYGRLVERNVWPGIDVAWYGNQHQLESDFIVAAHADPAAIGLTVDNASKVAIDASGDLVMGPLKLLKPVVYQGEGAHRRVIAGRYALSASGASPRRVSFVIAAYDHAKPLVIDPGVALDYSTYLGGTGLSGDGGNSIAVDSSGSSYVTGFTSSADFPLQSSFQGALKDGTNAFVTKFSADGTSLVYSTYLGGSGGDSGNGIAVNSSGSAYLTGSTASADFPTRDAFQGGLIGSSNAFVTKFSPDGASLVYSTYLGGGGGDNGSGIAVDSSGSAYVTGSTSSASFPVQNPFQSSLKGPVTAFVTKFSASGGALVYSTYLGGSEGDLSAGIAVDSTGDAYVTGTTGSDDFPLQNAFQNMRKGGSAFITEFTVDGSGLVYSTYLGGTGSLTASSIAVDSSGDAYVTGWTASSDFPTQNAFNGSRTCRDFCNDIGFVTKFSAGGTSLSYSTYFGGSGEFGSGTRQIGDHIYGIAVDSLGRAYVSGETFSLDFPTVNPFQATNNSVHCQNRDNFSCGNAFVSQFSVDGSSLIYSTYLGGSGDAVLFGDSGSSIAVDAVGNAYVTGSTGSSDFPTQSPFQSSNKQPTCTIIGPCGTNAFVSKFAAFSPIPTLTPTPSPSLTPTPTSTTSVTVTPAELDFKNVDATASSKTKELTLNNEGAAGAQIAQLVPPVSFVITDDNCSNTILAIEQKCTIDLTFVPAAPGSVSEAFAIPYNGLSPSETLDGSGLAVTLKAPKSVTLPSTAAGTLGKAKSVKIKNNSDAAVTINGQGFDTFYLITADGCANGTTLAPKAECIEALAFNPPAGSNGTLSGAFIFDFAYGANNGSVTVSIKGKVK